MIKSSRGSNFFMILSIFEIIFCMGFFFMEMPEKIEEEE